MQDSPALKAPPILEAGPTNENIMLVKNIIAAQLIALRNYSLYPSDHAMCQNSLSTVHRCLSGFLADHECLRLDVEKDRLLYQGEVVYQGPSQGDSPASQLFRDGIRWLEFQVGLTEDELSVFFNLLNQYRITKEEAEGDMATALWEADFPHLQYKAEGALNEAHALIDFSLMKARPENIQPVEETAEEPPSPSAPISILSADPILFKLTPAEENAIKAMILEEETRDVTDDVLELLMIILKEQRDPENFAATLDFLVEEFHYTLAQGEFTFIRKFLESLTALQGESFALDKPWVLPLLDNFRKEISSPEVLGDMEQAWPQINLTDSDRLEAFRQALMLFPADVVLTLGPMLLKVSFPHIEHLLIEVISAHASRDMQSLQYLLKEAEEPLIHKLIPMLQQMREQEAAKLLIGLTLNSSEPIRKAAINALVAGDQQNIRGLFPLIEDPTLSVRNLILDHLRKRRDPLAEELLLNYLEHKRYKLKDSQHLLACYRALGRCASPRSLPFLRETLLKQDWKAFLGIGDFLHRQGAALA
ncbi:MAG: hypothetical protein Q8K46_07280, partial [Deltaproteobacteria bacterium]|nr:hypothetical protein [Deltaproteobacteria bacterium]